tara:strand:+ start:194 stop:928 length:735 start_codon:yes stop_codon:yes gene_type:complete
MITIVLGMHRSGTSTVAGILHLNNISMGTYQSFWPRPLPQNPKGFYENFDFRKINDKMLKKAGYTVKSYETEIPEPIVSDRLKKSMIKMVNKYESDFDDWGWKDPRTCVTMPQWLDVFLENGIKDKIKIIFVTRKAIAVARSLKKRNELPLDHGLNLWKSYTERAFDFCQHTELPTFYMSFEGLLESPEIHCEKLFDFLDRSFEPKIVTQFVDKKISTSGKGEAIELPEPISDLEREIEKKLSV